MSRGPVAVLLGLVRVQHIRLLMQAAEGQCQLARISLALHHQHSTKHTGRAVAHACTFSPAGRAQVHRAVLRVGGRPCQVAVKVRHPGVARQIWQDFQLLGPLAGLTSSIPSLRVSRASLTYTTILAWPTLHRAAFSCIA